jgi:nucleotide-binding universal stress UspA family protein
MADMLRALASFYVHPYFAAGASLVFALLLLSAVNTAVTDLVSIQFMMARDQELPPVFGGLNKWGMPLVPLVLATLVPLATVLAIHEVQTLADLYAIGVVGAVAINLGSCSTNWQLALGRRERAGMLVLTVLLVAIWVTIALEKPWALAFALSILTVGMAARWLARNRERVVAWLLTPIPHPLAVEFVECVEMSWAGPPAAPPTDSAVAALVPVPAAPRASRVLVATRGNPKLLQFALEQARARQAELLVLFVQHIAVPTLRSSRVADAKTDPEAQDFFRQVEERAAQAKVPVRPLYAVAWDVADAILDTAATYDVELLLLGSTRRSSLWRIIKGDVIRQVARYLPDRVGLLIHA